MEDMSDRRSSRPVEEAEESSVAIESPPEEDELDANSMILGFGPEFMTKGNDKESVGRLKKLMTIMDSMSVTELDHPKASELFSKEPRRVIRFARGSGTTHAEVRDLFSQYKKFSDMVKKMGSIKGLFSGKNGDINPKKVNPAQMMKVNHQRQR
ncbi:unnamed protein product [Cylicocyclus nassatus]|uniref:Signal recognition particle SRP54 subunit M-domain domain-containing protein n=1 Tax=Cylicocyclus nassatus TaxID=53992 RepID=A0AA36HBR5_CYLNA|nr:unnamed protein product [Cylicocyclus nassatus]